MIFLAILSSPTMHLKQKLYNFIVVCVQWQSILFCSNLFHGDTGINLLHPNLLEAELCLAHTHPHQAAAHVGVGDGEVGLRDSLLEDEVDDSLQTLLGVDGELGHLLHQWLEHLRRQFVQHAPHAFEQLLRLQELGFVLDGAGAGVDAAAALHRRLPGLLCFIQLHVFSEGNARDDLPRLLPALALTWTTRTAQTGRLGRQGKIIFNKINYIYLYIQFYL